MLFYLGLYRAGFFDAFSDAFISAFISICISRLQLALHPERCCIRNISSSYISRGRGRFPTYAMREVCACRKNLRSRQYAPGVPLSDCRRAQALLSPKRHPRVLSIGEGLTASTGDDRREYGMVKMPRWDKRKRTKLQMRKMTVGVDGKSANECCWSPPNVIPCVTTNY